MVFGDFAVLPPEIISAQIYTGPGAQSLLAAAAAWDALAAELHSTASSYGSAISELISESWEGPSSASMAAAAAPYVNWISTTAAQAEQTAAQARAAASAYEAALAATVPPAVVAANRSQLASLQATNILGQNGAAIAATEAEYGQMWAQDVAAMFSYASSSTAAGQLTPFEEAPATTKDTSNATQTASASSTSSTTSLSSWLTQLESYINSLTKQYTSSWENLLGGTGNSQIAPAWEQLYSSVKNISGQVTWANTVGAGFSTGTAGWKGGFVYAPWSAGLPKAVLGAGLGSPGRLAAGVSVKPISAILGNAPTVGKLSVPSSWATAAPAIRLSSIALPATNVAAAPAAGFPPGLVNEATLGSLAGGALGSPASRVVRSTGIQTRPITGERRTGPVKLDRIIAQLQEMPDQVQHWNVDEAGLDDLVARLRTTPGVHAVHVSDEQEAAPAPEPQLG
ncbi:PPE family protein [Mycobacterium malmoense]|uniref:PPE family protein n=1 Tax=Mycobacterium malmoense TaxID=1780 RepID=A0ABX3SSU8_MYCMA|nr:PPE family protein [Mycobacterium malmoense]ORA82409.1 PPE family protein [Mycobacterium malmoense]QZA18047.1 PPE family protein [Mycobacterium malmoense]UNB94823.1 PPE family protein [Mycobacterium malmoense]